MKLYGRNPVLERIRSNPKSIRKLYLQKGTDLSAIVRETKAKNISFQSVDKQTFTRLSGDVHAQGVVAEIDDFNYTPFNEVIDEAINKNIVPVFVDGVTDPQNLGSIIRNLACLGGYNLVIPKHNSAFINDTVLRVASGGENYVKIAMVENISTSIKNSKQKGLWIIGAIAEGGEDITRLELVRPLAVVIGSEGKGIRPGIIKNLDKGVTLPMEGAQLSYNVSIATALFCYEIKRKGY